MRLCRLPCGKPPAFRQAGNSLGGYAAPRRSLSFVKWRTESRRLSAREAAQPQEQLIADAWATTSLRADRENRNLRRDSKPQWQDTCSNPSRHKQMLSVFFDVSRSVLLSEV